MKHHTDFLLRKVGGENLLIPLGAQVMDLNGLITLNETGAFLWELLAEERSLEELAAAVTEQFEVLPEQALADVRTFLDEIGRRGMLQA